METEIKGTEKVHRELRFLLKIFLFCLPLAILIGFPLWVAWRSGELIPDNVLAQEQASNSRSILVGLDLSNPVVYLDLQAVLLRNPDVVVLGSSRVGQIRSTFFNEGLGVSIANGAVQKIGHFAPFLNNIPSSETPKLLVIGLDQKFFDPNYDNLAPDNINDLLTQQIPAMDVFSDWPAVYEHYFHGEFSLAEILHPNSSLVGLAAITKGLGYRNDMSYNPGPAIYESSNASLADIDQGTEDFAYSNIISQGSLAVLDNFLSECKKRGIYVIGFEPPFSLQIYAKLQSMPNDYGFMNQIPSDVNPIFRKYGFEFYNYTNPASLGIADKDMKDGLHMTERGSLMLFSAIAEKSSVLRQYTNPQRLENAINATNAQIDILKD